MAIQATPLVTGNALPVALQGLNVALGEIAGRINKLIEAQKKQRAETETAAKATLNLGAALGGFSGGVGVLRNVTGLAINSLHQLTGAISANVASFVQMYSPVEAIKLNLVLRDLQASIGAALVPTLQKMIAGVRGIADVIASLSPPSRALIAALVSAGVGMVALTVASELFAAAAASATGGLSLVLGAVVGGLASIAFVSKDFAAVKSAVAQLSVVGRQVFEVLGGAFARVVAAAQPIIDKFGAVASALTGPLLNYLENFADMLGGLLADLAPAIEAMLPAFQQAVAAIYQLAGGLLSLNFNLILRPLATVFSALAPVLALVGTPLRLMVSLIGTLAQVVGGILGPAIQLLLVPVTVVGRVFAAVADAIGGAVGELQDAFSEVGRLAAEIGGVIGELTTEILKALQPVTDWLKQVALDAVRQFVGAIRTLADWIKEVVRQVRDFFGIEARLRVDPKGKSEGLAVRQVSSGDVFSVIRKAQENALAAGRTANDSPAVKAVNHLQNIDKNIQELPGKLAEAIKNAGIGAAQGAVQGAGQGAASGVIPGMLGRDTVRMITG